MHRFEFPIWIRACSVSCGYGPSLTDPQWLRTAWPPESLRLQHPVQTIREDFGTARFDMNISNKDTFSTAATVDDGHNISPLTNPFFGTIALLRSQVYSAQETHVFSRNS